MSGEQNGGGGDDDQRLLDRYVKDGSGEAFGGLVARYVGLVRGSARRQLRGDRERLADDVTQAVFMVLARRAGSIRDAAVLPAWLIKTTYFASRDAIKLEMRRRRHEHKAAEMNLTRTLATPPAADVGLSDIEPILDAALARLKPIDRALLTRRFLQQQSVEQVALEMKMSPDAVRKRMSRVLPTLRIYLTRRGVTLSVAALAALLSEMYAASSAGAAETASVAADALKPIGVATSAASNAIHIARRVLARMSFRPILVSAVMLLSLMLACAMALAVNHVRPSSPASPATPQAGAQAHRMRVGFMISDYTATGPGDDHGLNIPQRLDSLLRALRKVDDPECDRFAILEPNTADKGRIPMILHQSFAAPDHILDGTRAQDLRKLDVIVCPGCLNMRDDVIDAMTLVINEGVGLLNQNTTGCNRPGLTEAVNRINGMTRYGCLYNAASGGWDCDVLADHAIVAELQPGRKLRLQPDFLGSLGLIRDGTPILAAPGLANMHHIATTMPADTVFYPMYLSHLGKGKIVCLQWNTKGADAAQPALEASTGGRLYPRCLQWLANRPVR